MYQASIRRSILKRLKRFQIPKNGPILIQKNESILVYFCYHCVEETPGAVEPVGPVQIACRHIPFSPAESGNRGNVFDSGIFTPFNLPSQKSKPEHNSHSHLNSRSRSHRIQTLRSNFHAEPAGKAAEFDDLDDLNERDEFPNFDPFPAESRSASGSRGESVFLPTLSTGRSVVSADSPAIPVVMTGTDAFWVQLGVSVENIRCELRTAQTSLNFGKLFTNTRYEYSIKLWNSVRAAFVERGVERRGRAGAVLAVVQLQHGPHQRREGAAHPAQRLEPHEDRAHALRGRELPRFPFLNGSIVGQDRRAESAERHARADVQAAGHHLQRGRFPDPLAAAHLTGEFPAQYRGAGLSEAAESDGAGFVVYDFGAERGIAAVAGGFVFPGEERGCEGGRNTIIQGWSTIIKGFEWEWDTIEWNRIFKRWNTIGWNTILSGWNTIPNQRESFFPPLRNTFLP